MEVLENIKEMSSRSIVSNQWKAFINDHIKCCLIRKRTGESKTYFSKHIFLVYATNWILELKQPKANQSIASIIGSDQIIFPKNFVPRRQNRVDV